MDWQKLRLLQLSIYQCVYTIGYLSLENLATQWSNDQKMEEVCYFNQGTVLLPGRMYTFVVWVKLTDTPR